MVSGKLVTRNADDGIELNNSPKNKLTANASHGNGDGGITFQGATGNTADVNIIDGNGDGLVNVLNCISGKKNKGSNVPTACK